MWQLPCPLSCKAKIVPTHCMSCFRLLKIGCLVTLLALGGACARQSSMQTSPLNGLGQPGDEHSLPFDQQGSKTGRSFVPSEELPAGTPITVRLQHAVSSQTSQVGDRFQALVDEPLVVDGRTLLGRGAKVEGTIIAARPSTSTTVPGYLRLTLSSLYVNGDPIALATNSIFSKADSHRKRTPSSGPRDAAVGNGALVGASLGEPSQPSASEPRDVNFAVQHRLTFRLTQSVRLKD